MATKAVSKVKAFWPSLICMNLLYLMGLNFEISFVSEKHVVEDDRYIVYKSSGGKIGNSSRGRGVPPFHIGRTWFKLSVTSSIQFLPVVAHDK